MTEYEHLAIEKKWQEYWAANHTFRAPRMPGKKKLYCLDMFPYPSGTGLHVGHPLGYIATDIFSRAKRMQGYSVLHPMGWDAFGLPAEQHAVNTGEHPSIITEKNCETFKRQMETIGLSYDWERELFTCRADYYRWTQWIFLQLYNSYFDENVQKARPIAELSIPSEISKAGAKAIHDYQAEHRLAYYANAMVNWCPALGTVLANEEVINGKSERGGHDVIRKPMKQWMLRITKYSERLLSELEEINWPENIKEQQRNWIGKRYGTEIDFQILGEQATVAAFTTRPDTLFGVTFFVLSPEHPMLDQLTKPEFADKVSKYRDNALKMSDLSRTIENRKKTGVFTGSHVLNPINGEQVPVYVGDYVLMSFGTGAVMGVPAHDDRDFEFARTFELDIRPVLAPKQASDPESSERYLAVIQGELAYTDPGAMLPNDSPVFRELALAGKANEVAKEAITDWLSQKRKGRKIINYKLRDWLFSRQRYWGEPIPIIHWEDGTSSALSDSELPLILPPVQDFKPSDGGESPLAKSVDWLTVTDPKTGRKGRRETNTMPQWAGSCWYYLRFIDPHNDKAAWDKELEKAWMPVDLYLGGAEHAVLHLLYARFWHKVLFDLGHVSTREPFQKLYNQGMILASAFKNRRGALVPVDEVEELPSGVAKHIASGEELERITAKMSKSLRNVVTPDEIIHKFGADTLRTYEMFMGPLDASRVWDPKAISGNYRFLKRTWAFVTGNQPIGTRATAAGEPESVTRAIHKAVKKVGEDIEAMSFNTCISTMMEFLNEASTHPVSQQTLEKFVSILAPFAPHIAEEMWQRLGHKDSVQLAAWPTFDTAMLQSDTVTVVIQVQGKKRASVDVSISISEDELKQLVIDRMASTEYKIKESDRFITVLHAETKVPRLINVIPL